MNRLAVEGGRVAILFDYDPELILAVKQVKGARWDGAAGRKCWYVPGTLEYLRGLGEFAKAHGFEIPEEMRELWRRLKGAEKVNVIASRAETADIVIPGLGGTLRPFQRAGVTYMVRVERALLGDEMGLGKTAQGLAALQAVNGFPAVIACPASLQYNWQREIMRWLPGRSISIVDKDHPPAGTDITIINYAILPKHAAKLAELHPAAVIYDEAHYLKNGKAARTKAAAAVAKGVRYRFLLTGTPIDNGDPAEILPLLQILGRADDFGGPQSFLKDYCECKLEPVFIRGCKRIGAMPCEEITFARVKEGDEVLLSARSWERFEVAAKSPAGLTLKRRLSTRTVKAADFTGWHRVVKRLSKSSTDMDLRKLSTKLRATCMIRRLKRDVATELPSKQQSLIPVDITTAAEFKAAQADILEWVARRAANDASIRAQVAGLDAAGKMQFVMKRAMEAHYRAESAEELVKMNALLQIGARGKLDAAKDWIRSFLATGESLVVFAEHAAIIEEICAEFGVPAITGATPMKERQRIVDAFQAGEQPLIPLNWQAGGVGLTLTRASHVLGLELPWKPATLDQGEDRCHRIGQLNPVNAWYLMGRGTLDGMLWNMIRAKREVARKGLGDGK